MELIPFIAAIVNILAGSLDLEASRRLISEVLSDLYAKPQKVCLSGLVKAIGELRVHPLSRLGQYKEAAYASLKDLLLRTGDCLNYTESNFLPLVFSEPKTFLISCGEFDPSHLAVLISAFCLYIYEIRRSTGSANPPVLFVLDDAMSLAFGSLARESEHVARPIVNWLLHARSLNINFCFSVQDFASTSPAIRNNCQTLVCLGSTGEDAVEVARHMNLTAEQARVIPQLSPGRGIILARGQYPLAVEVFIPMAER